MLQEDSQPDSQGSGHGFTRGVQQELGLGGGQQDFFLGQQSLPPDGTAGIDLHFDWAFRSQRALWKDDS
jgi:hypothetical protein